MPLSIAMVNRLLCEQPNHRSQRVCDRMHVVSSFQRPQTQPAYDLWSRDTLDLPSNLTIHSSNSAISSLSKTFPGQCSDDVAKWYRLRSVEQSGYVCVLAWLGWLRRLDDRYSLTMFALLNSQTYPLYTRASISGCQSKELLDPMQLEMRLMEPDHSGLLS